MEGPVTPQLAFLRAAPDPITVVDGSGHMVFTNMSVLTLLDYTDDELHGHAIKLILPDLELPPVRRHAPKAYSDNFRFGRSSNWTH